MHCMGGALVGILYSLLLCLLMETKVANMKVWSWRWFLYSTIRRWEVEKQTGRKKDDKRRDDYGVVRCILL